MLVLVVECLVVFKGQFPTGAATWFLVAWWWPWPAPSSLCAAGGALRGEREALASGD